MNVNELMNMNDMYYVGNLVDVDGNGWVSKSEAIEILNELGMGDDDNNSDGYGDESPAEYKRMLATVGIKIQRARTKKYAALRVVQKSCGDRDDRI